MNGINFFPFILIELLAILVCQVSAGFRGIVKNKKNIAEILELKRNTSFTR